MELNDLQKKALKVALDGHNVLVTGAAGTGKTFLVRHMFHELSKRGINVSITASTGIACTLYNQAMTLHKWSGIGDGRYSKETIRSVVSNNVKFEDVRIRIKSTKVLIIDECSMISQKTFESLYEVLKIKDATLPFGGLQIIMVGDFLQLPPVPNAMYQDSGS